MKRVIAGLLFTSMHALPGVAADLTLEVSNIAEPQGELRWMIFDSAEDYAADRNPVIAGRSRVQGEALSVTLHDMPTGTYAVKLFHDANSNGKLDTNMVGLPKEGYGFSNNAGRFGPPGFDAAAVEVQADTLIDVRVR